MNPQLNAGTSTDDRFCRVTVLGDRTRADIALATGQTIGSLMPEIARLLPEPPGPRSMSLVTATGTELKSDSTLAENDIADGAILHLLTEELPPPAPVVNDITEEIAENLDRRADRFGRKSRRLFAVTLASVGPAAIAAEVWRAPGTHGLARAWIWAAGAVLLAGAALAARLGQRWWAAIAAVSAAMLAGGGAQLLASEQHWAVRDRLGVGLVLSWLGAFVVSAIWRAAGGAIGAAAGVLGSGAWWALPHLGLAAAEADALVVVAAVVAIGAVPRWAAVVSGLTSLDDSRSAGITVRRPVVRRTIGHAHQTMIATTFALSVLTAVPGVLLGSSPPRWSTVLAAVSALAVLLRSRAFPLTPEVAPLTLAGAAVAGSVLVAWASREPALVAPIAATIGLTTVGVIALMWRPSAHVQVRLRQLGDQLEAIAVIALIPAVLGAFGVYQRLLHTF